jgi:YD repeat-containing protein
VGAPGQAREALGRPAGDSHLVDVTQGQKSCRGVGTCRLARSPCGGHPALWRPQARWRPLGARLADWRPPNSVAATGALPPTRPCDPPRGCHAASWRPPCHPPAGRPAAAPTQPTSRPALSCGHPTPSRPPPCAGPPAAPTSPCRSPPRPPSCHMSSCGALSEDRAVRGDPGRPGAAQFPVICAPADASARIVAAPGALEGPPRAVRGSGLAVTLATMTSDRKAGPPGGRPAAAATQPPGSPRAFAWDAHKRPSGRHRAAGAAGSFRPMQRFDDSASDTSVACLPRTTSTSSPANSTGSPANWSLVFLPRKAVLILCVPDTKPTPRPGGWPGAAGATASDRRTAISAGGTGGARCQALSQGQTAYRHELSIHWTCPSSECTVRP